LTAAPLKKQKRKWFRKVQPRSDALDLQSGVFKEKSPRKMAASVLKSVKKSRRKKGSTLSSGISMMTYYVNRGGSKLPASRKKTIQAAKAEYRKLVAPRRA